MTDPNLPKQLVLPVWPPEWPEIGQAVQQSIQSGDWGRYDSVQRKLLVAELGEMHEAAHVRLVPSGSAAVELALRGCGVGAGDQVILSAYDYPGNFRAVELCGARPVLVDVADGRVTIDPDEVAAAMTPQTKAVLVSHLFGTAAPVGTLKDLCDARGIRLVEDACQTPGMRIAGRMAGTTGHIGTLSFGGSKPLTAGNGGAILTSDDRIAARLRPVLDRPSEAYPISPLQSAALRPQLARLMDTARQRAVAAEAIVAALGPAIQCFSDTPKYSGSPIQSDASVQNDESASSHYKLAFLAESPSHRSAIIAAAEESSIPVGAGFRTTAGASDRRCTKASRLSRSILLSDRVCTLHHTALLINSKHHQLLAETLAKLISESRP